MTIVIALLGFNDLGRSVTLIFLFRNRFYLQLSPHYPIMNKKAMWEVKKKFKISVHGTWNPAILLQQGETMVAKCELVLWRTSPVDWIHLIGPLTPYLAEKFPFKALIAIFWDLQPLWPSSLTKPDLLTFGCSSGHVLSKTKSVTSHFFYISDITKSLSFNGKIFKNIRILVDGA